MRISSLGSSAKIRRVLKTVSVMVALPSLISLVAWMLSPTALMSDILIIGVLGSGVLAFAVVMAVGLFQKVKSLLKHTGEKTVQPLDDSWDTELVFVSGNLA